MTFRDYLIAMAVGTVAAWAAFGVVVTSIDPLRSGLLGFLLFYATLVSAATGTLAIIGSAVRARFRPSDVISRQVARAFRQAVLLSLLLAACLLLLSAGFFRPWTGLLLVLAAALVELAFLSAQRGRA